MSRQVPSRGGRGGGRGRSVLVMMAVVVALAGMAMPAASFTTVDVPRDASVSVVDDANGVVGLDTAASVRKNKCDRLVTVTNNFDTERGFRIALGESDSKLYLKSDCSGNGANSKTLTLDPGASEDVYVEAAGDPNTLLKYDVRHTLTSGDEGVRFDLPRDAKIDPRGGGGPPGGGGSDPGCKNGNKQNCN